MVSAIGAVSVADGTVSLIAAADLSALQHTFVSVTADFTCNSMATTTGAIGILQNKPKAGEVALVKFMGGSKLVASGVIAIQAKITATTGGKGLATTTNTNHFYAIALEAAAADLEVISVLLTLGGMVAG